MAKRWIRVPGIRDEEAGGPCSLYASRYSRIGSHEPRLEHVLFIVERPGRDHQGNTRIVANRKGGT